MPWIANGVFVYQSFITEAKEWGFFVIAQSFMVYSILSVVTLLGSGFLIDKFTSEKTFDLYEHTFIVFYISFIFL